MIELIKTGGTTIIFLMVVSIVSLGFIIEKFFSLRYERKKMNNYRRFLEKSAFSPGSAAMPIPEKNTNNCMLTNAPVRLKNDL